MSGGPLCEFSLHHKAVLRCIDIAFEQTESDLGMVRIAFTNLDVSRLEFLAVSDEYDGPVLDRLECTGLDGDVDGLRSKQDATGDEQPRPRTLVVIADAGAREDALGIAVPDRRDIGDFCLDRLSAILQVYEDGIAEAHPVEVTPINREVDPDVRQVGDRERRFLLPYMLPKRKLPVDDRSGERCP